MNKRQQQSDIRRNAVLSAALQLFSRHSYKTTTVDTIAQQAGVSKGLVFVFFKNKVGLYEATLKHALTEWFDAVEAKSEKFPNALTSLEALYRAPFEFLRKNPVVAGMLRWDEEIVLHYWPTLIKKFRDQSHRRILQTIQRGIASGCLRADLEPEHCADVILSLQSALLVQIVNEKTLRLLDKPLEDSAVKMVILPMKKSAH